MAVTDREYLEMIAKNIDKRMTEGFMNINKTVERIEKTQKTNCADIQDLKSDRDKNKGVFTAVGQVINFIGLGILAVLQYFKG